MGDIADMMLNGSMCQYCGEILDGKGFPTVCHACQNELCVNEYGEKRAKKVKCDICGKRVKEAGIYNHMKDKHGNV